MTAELPDDVISGLIRRAMVPKGFRPHSADELDRALEALGDVDIATSRAQAIVSDILQDVEPRRHTNEYECDDALLRESEAVGELVEMFRMEGDIPPDIADRLKELEREAGLDEGTDGDEEVPDVE